MREGQAADTAHGSVGQAGPNAAKIHAAQV